MPLATVADMAAFLGRDIAPDDPQALFYLRLASGAVIGYLRYDPEFTMADVAVIDPVDGQAQAVIPWWPIAAVSKVEILPDSGDRVTWIDVTSKVIIRPDVAIVQALPRTLISWPSLPQSWRVTGDHGLDPLPDAIVAATAAVAGNNFATEAGIKSESQGGWSATYDRGGSLASGTAQALGLQPYQCPAVW